MAGPAERAQLRACRRSNSRPFAGLRAAAAGGRYADRPHGSSANGCARLGPPAIGALSHPFFGWEGSPTKIDYIKKGTLILTSPLVDLDVGQHRFGIPFWLVGEVTTPFRTYLVGIGIFTAISGF